MSFIEAIQPVCLPAVSISGEGRGGRRSVRRLAHDPHLKPPAGARPARAVSMLFWSLRNSRAASTGRARGEPTSPIRRSWSSGRRRHWTKVTRPGSICRPRPAIATSPGGRRRRRATVLGSAALAAAAGNSVAAGNCGRRRSVPPAGRAAARAAAAVGDDVEAEPWLFGRSRLMVPECAGRSA